MEGILFSFSCCLPIAYYYVLPGALLAENQDTAEQRDHSQGCNTAGGWGIAMPPPCHRANLCQHPTCGVCTCKLSPGARWNTEPFFHHPAATKQGLRGVKSQPMANVDSHSSAGSPFGSHQQPRDAQHTETLLRYPKGRRLWLH